MFKNLKFDADSFQQTVILFAIIILSVICLFIGQSELSNLLIGGLVGFYGGSKYKEKDKELK